jgi:arginine decarboxylase
VKWTLDDSQLVYGIGKEDLHFLSIDDNGKLCIQLNNHHITLQEVIHQVGATVRDKGYTRIPSLTLRIPQLIDSQIQKVSQIFQSIISEFEYQGKYRALYPLKVNPLKSVIHQILNHDPEHGLEACTKQEFLIALKELQNKKERLLMCNGMKDTEYLEIVRQALDKGYNIWISVESPKEAQNALRLLPRKKLQLVLRLKPYISIISHWGASTGRHSKFGLNIDDLFQTIHLLQQAKAEKSVVAIHAHPGSQVLGNIYEFTEYLAQAYIYLREIGMTNLKAINIGGGLPINYDGHLTPGIIHATVTAIIVALSKTLGKNYPHPEIISESGRAITALSALLLVRTTEVRRIFPEAPNKPKVPILTEVKNAQKAQAILDAWRDWLKQKSTRQELKDIHEYERETGYVKIHLRQLFVQCQDYEQYLNEPLAKDLLRPEFIIQGNFSVFNGACDHVLVDQYFPILPTTNLHTQPATLVRLVDITCDSDGEISNYIPHYNHKRLFTKDGFPLTTTQKHLLGGFPIGDLNSINDNYLAIALTGAYQNIIEMNPKLVGELPDIQLTLSRKGQWQITWLGVTQTIQDLATDTGFTLSHSEDTYID